MPMVYSFKIYLYNVSNAPLLKKPPFAFVSFPYFPTKHLNKL